MVTITVIGLMKILILFLKHQEEFKKKSEVEHLNLFRLNSIPIHIFRLPGIYGPGRSVFDKVRNGQLTEIIKKGHFFRVYVEDIVQQSQKH